MILKKRVIFVVLVIIVSLFLALASYASFFKKNNGQYCSDSSECNSNWCNNGICCNSPGVCCIYNAHCGDVYGRGMSQCGPGYTCIPPAEPAEPSEYCGDGSCNNGETCSSCSADCGSCQQQQPSQYCGDGSCNNDETCSSCSSDCGACEEKKSDGSSCSSSSQCNSGSCQAGVCCPSGQTCCDENSDCSSEQICSNSKVCVTSQCGDGTCSNIEDCYICPYDCVCGSAECCAPYMNENHNSIGCVASNKFTLGPNWGLINDRICCDGTDYSGDCCSTADCKAGETCTDHGCRAPVVLKKDGEECYDSMQEDCNSGHCQNGRCCQEGNVCCASDFTCVNEVGPDTHCNLKKYVCVSGVTADLLIENGNPTCWSNSYCKSGNCQNKWCCEPGKTCCGSSDQCPSGYYCHDKLAYCISNNEKPDGSICNRNDDCASDWCNKNTCCKKGKTCCSGYCDDQDYECGKEGYCVKKAESAEKKCYRGENEKFTGQIDAEGYIAHGASGIITPSEKGKEPYFMLCCDGSTVTTSTDGTWKPECCDNSDCEEGSICSSYSCDKLRDEKGIMADVFITPLSLFGFNMLGIQDYDVQDKTFEQQIMGVSANAIDAHSFAEVARYEFLKGQERLNNAKNLGYFKKLYDILDIVYISASFIDTVKQVRGQFNELRKIQTSIELVNHASKIASFADGLASLYEGIYKADKKMSSKIGFPKLDFGIMGQISAAVSTGGWSLMADISEGITENVESSANYEMEMAVLNLASAYHTEKMLAIISEETMNKYDNRMFRWAKTTPLTNEEARQAFFHAEQLLKLKKLEQLLKYRDDVAVWKEKPDLTVRLFSWFGVVDAASILEEKKKDLDLMNSKYDNALNDMEDLKKELGI